MSGPKVVEFNGEGRRAILESIESVSDLLKSPESVVCFAFVAKTKDGLGTVLAVSSVEEALLLSGALEIEAQDVFRQVYGE